MARPRPLGGPSAGPSAYKLNYPLFNRQKTVNKVN